MSSSTIQTSFGAYLSDLACKFIVHYTAKLRTDSLWSSLVCATSEYHITVTLRQHALLRSQNVGTCQINCSTLQGTQGDQFRAATVRLN